MVNAAVLGHHRDFTVHSAWAYGEVKGWPHSLQKSFKEAPGFYGVYILCVGAAAGLVLIPDAPLQLIIVSVQVLAGIMLPSAIVFLQLLLNDKEMLGEQFAQPALEQRRIDHHRPVVCAVSVLAVQVVALKAFGRIAAGC